MKSYSYVTQGVCATNVSFDIAGGRLYNVKFTGGCMGNLQAIAKLSEGKEAKEIAKILQGNDCRGKGTSCADQFAKAIETALLENKKIA